jgi:hypothetical protein
MIRILQILILLFPGQIIYGPQDMVSFEEEDITFEIEDSIFFVQGLYYFHSPVEKEYAFLFPFPTDTIYGKPCHIRVENISTGDTIIYQAKKDSSSIAFPLVVSGTTTLSISYHQKLKSNRAKYILVSTNYWEKPLKQVDYTLVTASDLDIKKFSFPPDTEIVLDNKRIYLWQKKNFRPTRDFEIEY